MSNKKNSKTKPKKSRKSTLKPARKSRTKTRKPKYLSLKLQLSSSSSTSSNHQPKTLQQRKPSKTLNMQQQKQQKLINLFPLRPENLVEQEHKDHQDHDQDQDHVAFLLQTTTDNTSTSLHDILDSNTATTTTSEEEEGSPSLSYFRGHENDHHENHQGLLRTAMKSCKERNESEERWVSYWEVVEKKELEEVSSDNSRVNCCYAVADALEKMVMKQIDHHDHEEDDKKLGLVGLKLDYQEILNAWSDKGPLYINGGVRDGESPQTVPDLLDASSNGIMDGWGSIWKVPEWGNKEGIKKEKEEEWKMGQREASVLRYKEKRQNRLFSKRIRYQVRKLNAEKRPRLKGRFVKRNGEE